MRFLCISDIHGNADALDKILAHGDQEGFDQLIVCGDLCYPGPEPLRVWKTLVKRNAVCVQGLGDRALCNIDPAKLAATTPEEQARIDDMKRVRTELGELILARLAKLPREARLPLESGELMQIVHGSPADPTESLARDMTEEELMPLLGSDPGHLVICGSSHEQFEGKIDEVHIVSVGSVGEAPGGTHALGAVITSAQTGYKVELIDVALQEDT